MTETWLNQLDTFTTTTLETMGYRLIQRPRTDGRHGGGIAILLGPDINLITSTDVDCNSNCEILRMTFTYNNSMITLLLIYRPPNNDYNKFFTDFTELVHGYSTFLNLIILGDINFHFDSVLNHHLTFKRLCTELNLAQHVNFPTHSRGHTLDIILTLSSSNLINRITRSTLLTDHYAIDCHINITKLRSTRRLTTYGSFKKIDYDSFSLNLIHSMQDDDITVQTLYTSLKPN